jgi:hypothetical protein
LPCNLPQSRLVCVQHISISDCRSISGWVLPINEICLSTPDFACSFINTHHAPRTPLFVARTNRRRTVSGNTRVCCVSVNVLLRVTSCASAARRSRCCEPRRMRRLVPTMGKTRGTAHLGSRVRTRLELRDQNAQRGVIEHDTHRTRDISTAYTRRSARHASQLPESPHPRASYSCRQSYSVVAGV